MGYNSLGNKLKLHLGVLVQSYSNSRIIKYLTRRTGRGFGSTTTADVAEILESKYGIMAAFWERHGQQTADELVDEWLISLAE